MNIEKIVVGVVGIAFLCYVGLPVVAPPMLEKHMNRVVPLTDYSVD